MYKFLLYSFIATTSFSWLLADSAQEQSLTQIQENILSSDDLDGSATDSVDESSTDDMQSNSGAESTSTEDSTPQDNVATSTESSDIDDRLTQLEAEIQTVYMKNAAGTAGAVFAPFAPVVNDYGWHIDAELLVWHIKSGAMDWVLALNQGVYPCDGDMINLGFHWSPGFRVGFGKSFQHDNWDLDLVYTYYKTSGTQHIASPFSTPVGTDSLPGVAGPTGTSSGSFKTKVFYNAIDLSLKKHYFVSKRVSIHPELAIKTVWLDLKDYLDTSVYVNALDTFTPIAGTVITNLKDTNKLWGIGPQAGLDLFWHLPKKMRLQTTIEGALLEGYFDLKQTQVIDILPTGTASTVEEIALNASTHKLVPYSRVVVGFGWGDYIRNKKQHIDLSLNWEFNYFWRANQTINQEVATTNVAGSSVRLLFNRYSEDIGFYGLNLKVLYSF